MATMNTPLPASASGAVGPSGQNFAQYMGFSVRETAGTAAVIRIRSGGAVTGRILDVISLAANESARDWYGPMGKRLDGQFYVELVSGTMPEGVLEYT